ncbi:uncharacterized protein BXZ73DRAFT_99179 [Epithele typhae]|uniref:uncharacterized protein n=1 Tax=Epithele typhae TaxID=378194 RepID=UPI002008C3B4|nr:uncharacterized protein BXZ73DRAFT_99179 [Epithele typhae]KAH9940183.1 hypothetical protein BXZ73DRAFT_99179 [Epithele typhae]
MRNVRRLILNFIYGTTTTLLEIARSLVQGGSLRLVDLKLSLLLVALTRATEADVAELADLTSRRPFSSVRHAMVCLSFDGIYYTDGRSPLGEIEDVEAAGAQALKILARMWPFISQDAQADLTLNDSISEIWNWSSEEMDAETGEDWDAEAEAGASFWKGEDVDNFEFTEESDVDLSFLSSLQKVRKLSLEFRNGTSTTLLEIARGLVQGNSPHLVDFTLYLPLVALTLATEANLVEIAELTSGKPFSSVKKASFTLYGYEKDVRASGARALEVLARMWPLISQDAQADLAIRIGPSEIWEWSREEKVAKIGENQDAEVTTGTPFWQGEGRLWHFHAGAWEE